MDRCLAMLFSTEAKEAEAEAELIEVMDATEERRVLRVDGRVLGVDGSGVGADILGA